ncbi:MAG TPA: C1 family peptidase [Bacteroidales bacterium]|jgi:aminopeptidase C|nr:C1 family peptidase [Bacteroidales bacterium]HPB88515.1 C1 family peptidase [Bacteroidales bacterium]HPH53260.1 C1 family peptidase [Bacteroidales bacterium]HPY21412.1 C1 family peptidase [Bacteroidales bacterium]HQA92502.1 C1 family peptidase [Bacteroidales bacterium]
MKRFLIIASAILIAASAFSQTQTIYKFTPVKDIEVTSVKDQARTGTCWCFATISLLEAELIRQGKGVYDLSEMFVVRHNYNKRISDNYLRLGRGNVGPGSLSHMTINAIAEHGIVPESVYGGIAYDSDKHNHSELSAFVKALSEVSVQRKVRSPEYWKIHEHLFDTYLGKLPEEFEYNGKKYTPKSFAAMLGFDDLSDYVEITSFTHHPFYQQVPLEIPDNWDHQLYYNVPLDEFMAIIDNALLNGYTVAWDGDLISKSFNHNRGIAIDPKPEFFEEAVKFEKIYPELDATQKLRQDYFETFQTVDDHLMHVTGLFKDQNGTKFYKTKNSWGTSRNEEMGGYLYMSETYVKMRTLAILVHKDAIPKEIRKKMGIK